MSFHDVTFPMRIARGAIGGPVRRTNIATRKNGKETRIATNANSLRRWQIASKNADLNDLATVVDFYEGRLGRLYTFRFRDPFDNKSCAPNNVPTETDQKIGVGDDANKVFQLVKNYGDAANYYARKITKPVLNTVLIAIDGTLKPTGFVVDYSTGIINFTIAPSAGQIITAGFEFDCMARFDNEQLELSLDGQSNGHIADILINEVL
jgi:uncharacterized protein (TIGR02217 family)